MSPYLVRPRAWWFNKVPLSVTLSLLLLDGGPLDTRALLALVLVVLIVCAVGNYGYALNDLYDIDEDARATRANAAAAIGRPRMAVIIAASGALALVLATAAGGAAAALLTAAELALPLIYSVPPLRIKERRWLGVVADAAAAHVYPAALAMLVVAHLTGRSLPAAAIACVLAWSAAAGLRGFLSHLLHTAERDRQGGLVTLVHTLGPLGLERAIVRVLLPIEALGFVGAVAGSGAGPVLFLFGALYLALEAYKTLSGRFVSTAFRAEGQPYRPLVDEMFYKAWGPVVIALDAARLDGAFLGLVPTYFVLFEHHLTGEAARIRAVLATLRR